MLPSSRIAAFLFLLLGMSAGCTCGAFDPDTTRFACVTDAECGAQFNCVDVAGGRECIASCATTQVCPPGRECRTGVCADVDECAASGRCGAEALCVNTPGSWECRCPQGFSGTPTLGRPATCVDVDECLEQDCGPLGRCTNTTGSFECSCTPGAFGGTVVGGPTSCSTVDRCTAPGQCGANATCVSTATSFTCTCTQGYLGATTTGNAASCTDADECVSPVICGANASCSNTLGSFGCACQPGFAGTTTTGMAATCSDVDECPTVSCGANAHCTNTPGTYGCSCDTNFFGAAVTGGPAVCSLIDRCSGVDCGANAACTSGTTDYTCACNAGFMGAPMMGAQASCSDLDECGSPAACGANALCTNSLGSYACACRSGFNGSPTVGTPATCTPGVAVLGTAVTSGAAPFVLSRVVAAGERLVLVVISGSGSGAGVSDSRGNSWVRLVNNTSCGACGSAELWSSLVTTGLQLGDTVTVSVNSTSALWLGHAGSYVSFDTTGTYNGNSATSAPAITTNAAVLEPDELLIGALVTRSFTTIDLDGGGFVEEFALADGGALSGMIASRIATGLSGVQTFGATANPAQRFSGVLATFYSAPPSLPAALSLSHTPGNRGFTVSWTGGRGNGGSNGCSVQVQLALGSWTSTGSVNCDADTIGRALNLPLAANWYGATWATVPARLVRSSDGVVVGTFLSRLTCAARPASSVATPTIDEDCDGTWDDRICSTHTWVSGTVYPATFTACTNSADTTTSKPCAATNELENRYTEGSSTFVSPAAVFSSSSFGSACQGPFTGATTWTCTPSNCTYR